MATTSNTKSDPNPNPKWWASLSGPTKTGIVAAVIGLLLIVAAGLLTAADHIGGIKAMPCAVASPVPSQPPQSLQILAVRAGPNEKFPVIELGRPACITLAGVKSNVELAPLRAAVKAAEDALAATNKQQPVGQAPRADAGVEPKAVDAQAELTKRTSTLTQARSALSAATQDVEVALYLDEMETPAHAMVAAIPEPQAARFTLESNSDAKSDDAVRLRKILHGLTAGSMRPVVIGIGLPNGTRPLAEWQPTDPKLPAQLRVFSPLAAWMAGIGFLFLLAAIFFVGQTTTLLRDAGTGSSYSLGRTQMAFWLIATVFGFVFIWVLTGQYRGVITTATFTLLGISGATALTVRAIDSSPSTTGTSGFLTDILSDGQGLQLQRIQVAIWTLVLGTIYLWNVLDSLVLTDFDSNLLILVGIANGVYAGFKFKEN